MQVSGVVFDPTCDSIVRHHPLTGHIAKQSAADGDNDWKAITTALSPDRTMSIPMIFSSAAQDSGVNRVSNMFSNEILGPKP